MNPTIINVALLSASMIVLAVCVLFIWPARARAQFALEVTQIRCEVDDEVLDGTLPDTAPIRELLRRSALLVEDSDALSWAALFAIHLTLREHGVESEKSPRLTYGGLHPAQRSRMHAYDERLNNALARRLVRGSAFALPWLVLRRLVKREDNRPTILAADRQPYCLAREYRRVPFGRDMLILH